MTVLEFLPDKSGFPMLRVNAINAYIQWLPVTKIEFEYFLCDMPGSFSADWYDLICNLNPRVTPTEIKPDNYWRAFLTGITPSEAQKYARWQGEGYYIPAQNEWVKAYDALKLMSAEDISVVIESMGPLRDRTRMLVTKLDAARRKQEDSRNNLADQIFLRKGVIEWVECDGTNVRWGGMGQTNSRFHGGLMTPDHGRPSLPNNPEANRLEHYGLRLFWRPE